MKNFLIQLVAILFIAFTPFANWFALPLFVLLNPILALASGVIVFGTSRQEGTQLVLDRNSGAWIVLQLWYWTNVALAIPCMVFCVFAILVTLGRS
jgi:hypothetical protein